MPEPNHRPGYYQVADCISWLLCIAGAAHAGVGVLLFLRTLTEIEQAEGPGVPPEMVVQLGVCCSIAAAGLVFGALGVGLWMLKDLATRDVV